MKTTIEPMFSNGTEFTSWTFRNCDRCLKQSHYNEKNDTYSAFRCTIDRDISMQAAGFTEVNVKSYETAHLKDCPYIQTERKSPKKTKYKKPIKIRIMSKGYLKIKTKSYNFYLIQLEKDAKEIQIITDIDTTSVHFNSEIVGRSCVHQVIGKWKFECMLSKLTNERAMIIELVENKEQLKLLNGVWVILVETM